MDFDVRSAEPADTAALLAVEADAAQLFGSVEGLEWLAGHVGSTPEDYLRLVTARTVWVVENDVAIVGFLAARVQRSDLHIVEVSVRREHQRRGLARRLIRRAVDEARRRGLTALTLTTFRGLTWNEQLYSKLGFLTLDGEAIPPSLKRELDLDAAAGLPRERRCAMRLHL